MSGLITAAVVIGGASAASSKGQQREAEKLQGKLEPSNALELRLLQARAVAADKLSAMADKLEAGEPLSNAERTFFASVQQQANRSIEEARSETLGNVLGTAAGTGFLRAGRTQGQARQTNIDAEISRNQAAINREQQELNRGFKRTVELPAQLRQAVLTGAQGKGQTFIPQVSNLQIGGQAVGAAASTFLTGSIAKDNNAQQTQALQNLLGQIGTGQGGTTAGGTSVQQSGASQQDLQDLISVLQSQDKALA